jgi:hypothetical protein
MNSHNDVEQLIEARLHAQEVLDGIESCILETDLGYDVYAVAHHMAVGAEHEADDMLDAAFDEVLAATFTEPEPDPDDEFEPDEWCRIPGKGYNELLMWIGLSERTRIKELQRAKSAF